VQERRCDVAGVVDETQVDDVFHQWAANGVSAWKIPLLEAVLTGAPFAGKPSTRWAPGSLHDFMHAKVVVADDVAFVGSFNFSRSGEQNAENVLELHDAALADRLAAFVDGIRTLYPRTTPPRSEA
jgi:phosphatidylserine/phosphatidylglycerophosphate/cardiolipin synthase-like enzyme